MAAKKTGPQHPVPQQSAGEGDVSAATSPHPADTFTWTARSGGKPITLPKADSIIRPGHSVGFFLKLNRIKNPALQVAFLLENAEVDESVQDQIYDLADDEIFELTSAWTGDSWGATPGE